jgi:hypothetical protein
MASFTMEEEMTRGLSTMLISGTFVLLFVNVALADGGTVGFGTDPQDRSLLSTWDKPAFAPGLYRNEVPGLDSRSATKGPKVDFLLSPQLQIFGPLVAQTVPSTRSELGNGSSSERPR